MTYKKIILERYPDKGIAKLILNRPDQLNCLDLEIAKEIEEAVRSVENDRSIRVLIVTGAGRAFSTGADLKAAMRVIESGGDDKSARAITQIISALDAIENLRIPVIAMVNGFAFAGGLELLLACDIAIAAEETLIGDQHANYGLLPGAGGSQRLPRKIGVEKAKYLLYTGEWLTGKQAEELGLVFKSVPLEQLEKFTEEFALKIAEKNPEGIRVMKYLVNKGIDMELKEGIRLETQEFFRYIKEERENLLEGLIAFKERRKPVFK
jgi:enoyl-CoA hydratase/carnithine racemase